MWSVEASGIGSPSKSLSDIITGITFGKGKARLVLPVKAYVILAVGWKAASWWTSAIPWASSRRLPDLWGREVRSVEGIAVRMRKVDS